MLISVFDRHIRTLSWRLQPVSPAVALLLVCALNPLQTLANSIVGSKHDLSASGPGPHKASGEQEVCIFCHTPHGGSQEAPLWNRYDPGATYRPYASTTVKATIGQPTGSSRLCLSCHDGTVAMGMVRSRSLIRMDGSSVLVGSSSCIGTDLGNDHPVSFKYDSALASSNGELREPVSLGAVKLDRERRVQCTSCHDSHDNRYGNFLVMRNYASSLCVTCHAKKDWQQSSHALSGATWNGLPPDPWPNTEESSVAANACENCHAPHNGNSSQRLLAHEEEEQNCYACHNGNVAAKNIKASFNKMSAHSVTASTGVHDPNEDLVNPARHVECADCHNPHSSNDAAASVPDASGALAHVKGIDTDGNAVEDVRFQYELCYRCHADSNARGAPRVDRLEVQTNVRKEFAPSNASYHPVAAIGKNSNVPSLKAPYNVNSQIYCTDCHNNDEGPNAGGSGSNGPHGSKWTPLLERQQVLTDYTPESPAAYALCYKCHDRASILNGDGFLWHSLHIENAQTACTTCHDPHGSSGNKNLINFNSDYVTPNWMGELEWNDDSGGPFTGSCSLSCHGYDHVPSYY